MASTLLNERRRDLSQKEEPAFDSTFRKLMPPQRYGDNAKPRKTFPIDAVFGSQLPVIMAERVISPAWLRIPGISAADT
jgi:hypothetical protein